MTKTSYNSRVTALITAIDNLGGLLDSDLSAVKPWADEIKALQEAVRQINTTEPPRERLDAHQLGYVLLLKRFARQRRLYPCRLRRPHRKTL